jgi:hypothetical protein
VEWIREYCRLNFPNLHIAPNTEELTDQLSDVFHGNFVYLPNVYNCRSFHRSEKDKDWRLNIGCFGAIRPMKNTFQQAIAAIEFANLQGRTLRFHINATRVEQGGENVLKNIRSLFKGSPHELIEHPWLSHPEFLKLISEMDLGTQVSFSESFNIVTADFVNAGVPIVASKDIEWMPWLLKADPADPDDILRKMWMAYRFKKPLAFLQKLYLNLNIVKAQSEWLKFLIKKA